MCPNENYNDHVLTDIPAQTASTGSTNVTASLVKTAPLVMTMSPTTPATVRTVLRGRIVGNTWTGAQLCLARIKPLVSRLNISINVSVLLDGPGKCVTSKWSAAKMLPSERVNILAPYIAKLVLGIISTW